MELTEGTIRPATAEDVAAITDIFNDAIENTTASFYTEPRTLEQQTAWLEKRESRFPVLVFESAGQVIGWTSLEPWNPRQGYRITGEVTFYVDHRFHRRGIGRRLLNSLIKLARDQQFVSLIAKITEGNDGSVRLVEDAGFQQVGRLQDVGEKFGRRLDVLYFQKPLSR